jgi:hypothetical protein
MNRRAVAGEMGIDRAGVLILQVKAVTEADETDDVGRVSPAPESFVSVHVIGGQNPNADPERVQERHPGNNGGRDARPEIAFKERLVLLFQIALRREAFVRRIDD